MRSINALLFLLVAAHVAAQDDGYFTLWGGPQAGAVKMPTFDEFATSFNTVNQADLSSELGSFGIARGFQVGGTYMLTKGIGFSLSYQQLRSNASARFTDGSSREFQLDVFTPINGGILFRVKRFDIQPRLGFCEAYMRTWTEYEDGTVSFGNERALNGTYRTFGLFAGLDLAMRIKLSNSMQLGVGAGWCGVSGSEFIEPNTARRVDTEPVYPISIPTDWERWLALRAVNDLPSYDVDEYVDFKGSWYYAFVNLMVDLK